MSRDIWDYLFERPTDKGSRKVSQAKQQRAALPHDWYVGARIMEVLDVMSFDEAIDLQEQEAFNPPAKRPHPSFAERMAQAVQNIPPDIRKQLFARFSQDYEQHVKETNYG